MLHSNGLDGLNGTYCHTVFQPAISRGDAEGKICHLDGVTIDNLVMF